MGFEEKYKEDLERRRLQRMVNESFAFALLSEKAAETYGCPYPYGSEFPSVPASLSGIKVMKSDCSKCRVCGCLKHPDYDLCKNWKQEQISRTK